MKYIKQFAFLIILLSTSAANASLFFAEILNGSADGTITYGTGANNNNAPVFSYTNGSGTLNNNLSGFTAGNYTAKFILEGLTLDINEDGNTDFTQTQLVNLANSNGVPTTGTVAGVTFTRSGTDPFTITSSPLFIPSLLPLAGSLGPLSWDINAITSGWFKYDFDVISGPNSNASINAQLAALDSYYSSSQTSNGVMTSKIAWNKLRVELNQVPEPAALSLFGLGLIGLFASKRKARS